MNDITYCTSADCPSKDCKIKLLNNKFQPGELISMADLSDECPDYYSDYDPQYCDGHFCSRDCEVCPYREEERGGEGD